MDRREFISFSGLATAALFCAQHAESIGSPLVKGNALDSFASGYIMTVRGKIPTAKMGNTLAHEHIITDFAGAEKNINPIYKNSEALIKVLPYLKELRNSGVSTMVECTPAYIGRNVRLLKMLSEASGLHIITNTGYYAAVNQKYIPKHAINESAERISLRWLQEWKSGIAGTGIRPGFIKLGVDSGPLKEMEKKLVKAAALTHLESGLKIFIHTGNAEAAKEEATLLKESGVGAEAFIWVHAQNDTIGDAHIELARKGCWISLDGVNAEDSSIQRYVEMILRMKNEHLLHKLLISHDDGFSVDLSASGEAVFSPYQNGNEKCYTTIFTKLKPALLERGITEQEFADLLIRNPAQALEIKFCRL